jgi:hypothetical protein
MSETDIQIYQGGLDKSWVLRPEQFPHLPAATKRCAAAVLGKCHALRCTLTFSVSTLLFAGRSAALPTLKQICFVPRVLIHIGFPSIRLGALLGVRFNDAFDPWRSISTIGGCSFSKERDRSGHGRSL